MNKKAVFCTSFCNFGHRLADGKPVGHQCFVLPTEALEAERQGDIDKAYQVLSAWKHRRVHHGLNSPSSGNK